MQTRSWSWVQGFAMLLGLDASGCGEGLDPAAPGASEIGSTAQALSRTRLGDPLPGLTAAQRAIFFEGERLFLRRLSVQEGLGPVFIEESCAACHGLGGPGGADRLKDANHFVTRFAIADKLASPPTYDNMARLGGDVRQTRSIAGRGTGCEVAPEVVPSLPAFAEAANNVSRRNPQQIFGAGLIDAIPDSVILGRQRTTPDADGVLGRANLSASGRPGRFGWKAQNADLLTFTAAAANGTMGFSTSVLPNEQRPQGVDAATLPGCSNAALSASSPNDADDHFLFHVTAWEALLAPPEPAHQHDGRCAHDEERGGAQVFQRVGCATCHTPETQIPADRNYRLVLGRHSLDVPQLNGARLALYSDLLVHTMGAPGSAADEGVIAGAVVDNRALGNQFRTAPLWGLSHRVRFLHDGRADSVAEAIRLHDGEARASRDRYLALPRRAQHELLRFLDSL